jgi:DNA-binding NtrC family response regulator
MFSLPFKEGLERWTEMYERSYLEHILHLSGGSVSGGARLAGVNRRFLQRLMKRHRYRVAGKPEES